MLECPAVVSWAWSTRYAGGIAGGGGERRMYPRVRRQELLCVGNRVSADLVLGRAHHASGDARPDPPHWRALGKLSAPLRALVISPATAPHVCGARANFRRPRHRMVRDDGSQFLAHCLQSATTASAQSRFG